MELREAYSALQAHQTGDPEQALVRAVRDAAASDPESFLAFLSRAPVDADCGLFEVYMALLDDSSPHTDVLAHEFRRLLELARSNPRNQFIYQQLDAYGIVHDNDALEGAMTSILSEALESPVPQVRRFAAFFAGDLVLPGSTLESQLRFLHEHDSDWRARHNARESLADLHSDYPSAAPPPRQSVRDRLLAWIPGNRASDYSAA